MSEKGRGRGRKKRRLRGYTALFLLSFAVCLVCAGAAIRILMEERDNAAANARAQAMMSAGAQSESTRDGAVLFSENDPAAGQTMNSDFTELYAANSDLVGWVRAGADIDLPVVRGADNQTYLTTDFYGQHNSAGSIFMDMENVLAPLDGHLVIYGHNMKSGAMFGKLPNYRKLEYLKEYPTLEFRTVYESADEAACVPFAIFDASMKEEDASYFRIRRFRFETNEEKQAFIDELRARSIFDIPVEVTPEDELISLVTCSYSNTDGRFILAMRKLREGEDVQTLAEQVRQAVSK